MLSDNILTNVQSFSSAVLNYDENELRSYLGIKSIDQFFELTDKIRYLSEAVLKESQAKCCWCKVDLNMLDDHNLQFGRLNVRSADLTKNLLNCDSAIIMCATLGAGVDRLIKKNLVKSSTDGVICNAIASAYIEGFCDILNNRFREKYGKLKPRFSCGYGDFDISYQSFILDLLDTRKNIGLYCTENYILVPSKSVTAVIGIMKG